MTIGRTVYLSGNFCPVEDATISPFDRGFLFAHAAYEVTSVYDGRFIDMEGHLSRLRRTLEGISIPNPYSDEQWAEILAL